MALERLSSEDRRRQIADAALRIIASQGAHRLTAMEIAKSLGITDAGVFRHYRDKDAIVAAAIARFEDLLAGDIDGDAPREPLDRLGEFFVRRLTKVRAHPEILRLAFDDRLAAIAGPEGAARVTRMIERSIGFVRGCLEAARREGTVAADVPVTHLVWMVVGSLRGAATAATITATPAAIWADVEKLLRRTRAPARRPAKRTRACAP